MRGTVTSVTRKEEGAAANSFITDTTLPSNGELDGKYILISWGNGWIWSYKIASVSGNAIITNDEPGFNYSGGDVDMRYFPVAEYCGLSSFSGPVTFTVIGSAVMDEMGVVESTGDETTSTSIKDINVLRKFELYPSTPNPFNSALKLSFEIPKEMDISIVFYNILGQEVRTLINTRMSPGTHSAIWDGNDNSGNALGDGVYLISLQAGKIFLRDKCMLVK